MCVQEGLAGNRNPTFEASFAFAQIFCSNNIYPSTLSVKWARCAAYKYGCVYTQFISQWAAATLGKLLEQSSFFPNTHRVHIYVYKLEEYKHIQNKP